MSRHGLRSLPWLCLLVCTAVAAQAPTPSTGSDTPDGSSSAVTENTSPTNTATAQPEPTPDTATEAGAGTTPAQTDVAALQEAPSQDHLVNGLDIYKRFRDGLADPECDAAATNGRWKQQFGHAPGQLAKADDDLLPLFGYVVDSLIEAGLPTEFALIPFVESGYRPGARSPSGPGGLWQFIGSTARNHGVPIREGYDGRYSPVDSTRAAISYLRTLDRMFDGDWRLAVMGYNAGEYRVLQSMRKAGVNTRTAKPAELPGLSRITYAYVEKLHALACILQQAEDRDEWLERLDRPVSRLAVHKLPQGTGNLDRWAAENGHDLARVRRLNPALTGKFSQGPRPMRVLAPLSSGAVAMASPIPPSSTTEPASTAGTQMDPGDPAGKQRSHTVRKGESAWTIARRYGVKPQRLLALNGLKPDSVLQPGMVLKLDESSR